MTGTEEVGALRARLEAAERRAERLAAELERLEAEHGMIQQENAHLTSLFVATARLHESERHQDVLRALEEILAMLVGTEEFGVYAVNAGRGELYPLHSAGLGDGAGRPLRLDDGPVGQALRSAVPYYAPAGERPVACVPLRWGERVSGVIVIYGLLPQKAELGPADRALLEVVGAHAAAALEMSRLRDVVVAQGGA